MVIGYALIGLGFCSSSIMLLILNWELVWYGIHLMLNLNPFKYHFWETDLPIFTHLYFCNFRNIALYVIFHQLEQYHQVLKFKGVTLFTFFQELKCKEQIDMLESCIEFRKNPQYLKNAETPHCATIAAFWCRQARRRQRHCVKVREEGGFRNWFSWFFSREAAHYTRF